MGESRRLYWELLSATSRLFQEGSTQNNNQKRLWPVSNSIGPVGSHPLSVHGDAVWRTVASTVISIKTSMPQATVNSSVENYACVLQSFRRQSTFSLKFSWTGNVQVAQGLGCGPVHTVIVHDSVNWPAHDHGFPVASACELSPQYRGSRYRGRKWRHKIMGKASPLDYRKHLRFIVNGRIHTTALSLLSRIIQASTRLAKH